MPHAIRGGIWGLCLAAVALAARPAAAKPFDQLVPEHATLFVSVAGVQDAAKRLEASPLGGVWKGPEMEVFIKKLSAAFDALVAESGKDAGFSAADYRDMFQGEAALVFGDPVGLDFKAERPEIPFAVLVDAGARKDRAREFLQKAFEAADRQGASNRREIEFHGQKITLLEKKEPGAGDPKAVAITLADDLLAVSLSQPFLEGILSNRSETAVKPLAEHADYKKLRAAYGRDAAVFAYAHPGRWIDHLPTLAKSMGDDGGGPQMGMATQVLDFIGLASVRAVCGSSTLTDEGVTQTLFVQAPGAPKGFLKALWTKPQPLRFPAIIPDDVNSCSVTQVDVEALWKMMEDGVRMFGAMMGGAPGPDGPADPLAAAEQQFGISFKLDLIAPLGRQMITYDRLRKPYTLQSQEMAVLFELKDKPRFQATIEKLLADGGHFLQKREFLGRIIYTVGGAGMPEEEEGDGDGNGQEKADAPPPIPRPSFCVIDTHLVYASTPGMVEEAIRRVGKEGRSINDAPGFKTVSGKLPASAIALSYQSPEIIEYGFALAKKFAAGDLAGLGLPFPIPFGGVEEDEEGDDPGKRFAKAIKEAFGALPDGGVVTKHVAGTVGYGFAEEQGLGFTSHFLYKK